MTAKRIKLWLIGAGLLMVAIRLVWMTYGNMQQEDCAKGGGSWNAEERVCLMEPPAAG